jgi:hypothetical protein
VICCLSWPDAGQASVIRYPSDLSTGLTFVKRVELPLHSEKVILW